MASAAAATVAWRNQIQAMTIGGGAGTFSYIDPAEARLRMADPNEYSRAWELWKRKLSRAGVDR